MRFIAISLILLDLSPARFVAAQTVSGSSSRVPIETVVGRVGVPLSASPMGAETIGLSAGIANPSILDAKTVGVAAAAPVSVEAAAAPQFQSLLEAAGPLQADANQNRAAAAQVQSRLGKVFDGGAPSDPDGAAVRAQEQFSELSSALRKYLQSRGYSVALKAYEFARTYHVGKRKDGVTPEFQHQVEIALFLNTLKDAGNEERLIAAAMLHDVMEDYDVPREEIESRFGKDLADSVWRLTKVHRGTKKDMASYFSEIAKDPVASLVKGGDRVHNVQTMAGVFSFIKQKEYIAETEELVLPMIARAKARFPEHAAAYFAVEQRLNSQLKLYKSMHAAVESAAARDKEVPAPPQASGFKAMLPNLVTGLNMTSGLAAMLVAAHGLFLPAAGLILLAVVFDMLDGRTARALKVSSPLGLHLDSLADMVSFGAAPAFIAYQFALHALGPAGFIPAAIYAFGGLYRLARFNVGAIAAQAEPQKPHSDNFTGLPIPGGAGVIVSLYLASSFIPAPWLLPVSVAATLVAAAAMVSTLPYPAFKKNIKAAIPLAAAAAAASLGLAVAGLYALIPAAVFAIYLVTGPLKAIYEGGSDAFRFEVGRKAFHQSTLIFAALYWLAGFPLAGYLAAGWLAGFAVLETLRLKTAWGRDLAKRWFSGIVREKEANRFTGAFFDTLGVTISMIAFGSHPAIVIASILYLAWGDSASALVGRRWGQHKYQVRGETRSVEGTAAGFAVALAVGVACGFAPWIALGAAVAFSLVDTIPVKPDDNLYIPIVTGTVLFLLSLI